MSRDFGLAANHFFKFTKQAAKVVLAACFVKDEFFMVF